MLIRAPRDKVFDYVADYENVVKWAKNFILGLRRTSKGWIAKTPLGEQTFEIVADRSTGVVDQILNGFALPTRVIGLGPVTLYTFTLILPPDLRDEQFKAGIQGLEEELSTLKVLVETEDGRQEN